MPARHLVIRQQRINALVRYAMQSSSLPLNELKNELLDYARRNYHVSTPTARDYIETTLAILDKQEDTMQTRLQVDK